MRVTFARKPTGSIADYVDFARFGQSLGYDRLWVPDQTFLHDPFVVLTAVATQVPGLPLGLAVTNPYTRHPAMIARAVASLADCTGGRFHLGMGAGNRVHVLNPLHIDGKGAPQRLREATTIIRQLLRGETVDHDGVWQLDGIALEQDPQPSVQLYLASRSPKVLQTAGEVADGAILEALVSPQGQAYAMGELATGAQRAGRDVQDIDVLAWQSIYIGERAAGMEALRPWGAYLLGMTPRPVALAMGIKEESIDPIHKAFREEGPQAAIPYVSDEDIDAVMLVGTPEQLVERVLALKAGGAREICVQVRDDSPASRTTLRRFAEEIRPHIS